ncbi:MAG: DUF3141 domain-containing protein [Pseudomonadota bacterium]
MTSDASGFETGEVMADLVSKSARGWQSAMQANMTAHLEQMTAHSRDFTGKLTALGGPQAIASAWTAYLRDASERAVLTAGVLQDRADITVEHNAAGNPPVLVYDYEVVMEARDLPRPSNYRLLHILPPEDAEVHAWKRPYLIVDPRAGHGPGIGGFKKDSQVGVALRDGHPVYFVAFHPEPVPGQTIADVTHSEADFLREIARRHPESPKPVIVGNCQGGWATAILAATHPALTGPIVLNGAPMSYWGGKVGQDPMRYSGGLNAGVVPALMAADLGAGVFDGAYLVQNFEALNPGRTWFRKYADVFQDPEGTAARFLEFERWWGGFFMMTKDEIRWIVENLFVGNKLGKNEAFLEPGRPIDLKRITAPIICFASHGDNITPPAQALNWIVDTYADESEIEIRGQRILYMVHEEVGHLGIFVSSSVARREHSNMASTLKTIEALPPGLYEMIIEDHEGEDHAKTFEVSFAKRTMDDLITETGARRDEAAFAGVARMSEALTELYETTISPVIRNAVREETAQIARRSHPMRASRTGLARDVPGMGGLTSAADMVKANRQPACDDNPFLVAERMATDMIETGLNMLRDMRGAAQELSFYALWANPAALWYGMPHAHTRTRKSTEDLAMLPEVQGALSRIATGGRAEAIVRMLILLASSRGEVRQDRIVRSAEVMHQRAPFDDMDETRRRDLIREQGLICRFDPEAAVDTLNQLLPRVGDKSAALDIVTYVLGDQSDMAPATRALFDRFEALFGKPANAAQ